MVFESFPNGPGGGGGQFEYLIFFLAQSLCLCAEAAYLFVLVKLHHWVEVAVERYLHRPIKIGVELLVYAFFLSNFLVVVTFALGHTVMIVKGLSRLVLN